MKKTSKGDFDYIRFDNVEEIKDFLLTMPLLLYADEASNLFCFDHMACRGARFDKDAYQWLPDTRKSFEDYEDLKTIEDGLAEKILKTIPPFDCFKKMEEERELETLRYYEELRQKTPHRVIGWLADIEDYRIANDPEGYYEAAVLTDLIDHDYVFTAMWFGLYPVFEDHTYLSLSDRSLGFLLALSQGEAKDYSYAAYAFGDMPEEGDPSKYNPPKEGLY